MYDSPLRHDILFRVRTVHAEFRAQAGGSMQVNVLHLGGAAFSVDMQQHANASGQAAGNWYLAGADEGHFRPAETACRYSGKGGIQIIGDCKNGAGDLVSLQFIAPNYGLKQFACSGQNLLAPILLNSSCSPDTPAIHCASTPFIESQVLSTYEK